MKPNYIFWTAVFLFVSSLFFSAAHYVFGQASDNVNTTVHVSICGNGIKEDGEECDGADLGGKTCSSLGFASGTLTCNIACGFETSGCVAPTIDPANVAPADTGSLTAGGYLTVASGGSLDSTSSLTAATQITINITESGGTNNVILPKDVVISKTDGSDINPTELTVADVSSDSLSGFSSGLTIDAALQWGISGTSLQFSIPITLDIYVGTSLNGQTLNIVRSTNLNSGWTNDGIVSPATCVVSAGLCTFQATKASYYATTRTTPSTGSSSSTSTSSTTGSSSTTTTTASNTTTNTFLSKPVLPPSLNYFDLGGKGIIPGSSLFNVVKLWVDSWKFALSGNKENNRCDINNDGVCDAVDLSILLFYVNR